VNSAFVRPFGTDPLHKNLVRSVSAAASAAASLTNTRWMGQPTTKAEPVLARVRRPMVSGSDWASDAQVASNTVYKSDRMLPWDISVRLDIRATLGQANFPRAPYRFDYSTLPES